MPEIKTELQIPDLWFDFYARFLPGIAFVGLVRTLVLQKTSIPSLLELGILVVLGYLIALLTQPLASRVAMWIEGFAQRQKNDHLFVRRVITDLGSDSRSAMILSKMHGEVTLYVQLACLGLLYYSVELVHPPAAARLGWRVFVFSTVVLLFSFEVAARRFRRASEQRVLLDRKTTTSSSTADRSDVMSESEIDGFGKRATTLSRSPLGIIALFIVLVDGFAALVLGASGKDLTVVQIPLVSFIVGFPILVLVVFAWLVIKHHHKLYGPSDFNDEKLFIELQKFRDFKAVADPVIERQTEAEVVSEPLRISTAPHELNENEKKVLKILADGKYTYRTVRGLAREATLGGVEMEAVISGLAAKNFVAQKTFKNGTRWYIAPQGREATAAIEAGASGPQTS